MVTQQPPEPSRERLRLVVMTASGRSASLNARLAELAAATIEAEGGRADLVGIKDFDVPPYDGDIEAEAGIPEGAKRFREKLREANGFVIASPEYNASMPGVLKNLIDWMSRFKPQPFNEHQGLLMSASPSMAGGNRGLWALRIPLEHLGARVYPDMFSLAQAHLGFAADGSLADETLQQRFVANIVNFMNLVEAATHYPCVKKAWVEYLGERPDPSIDRAEVAA